MATQPNDSVETNRKLLKQKVARDGVSDEKEIFNQNPEPDEDESHQLRGDEFLEPQDG